MTRLPASLRVGAAAVALLLTACSDQNPLGPTPLPAPVEVRATLLCTVDVRAASMTCAAQPQSAPATGANLDTRVYGGQELYVKLASFGTSYDSGTEIFQSNITVQNLLQYSIGTADGVTPSDVKVFFLSDPVATSGTGTITLDNADGVGTFTVGTQSYFSYPGILTPYEISDAKNWRFNIPPTVSTFTFTLAIAATVQSNATPLLDKVWEGDVSTDWSAGGNWTGGTAPDSSNVVSIPADSLFGGVMPVMTANGRAGHLRLGFGSTLNQGGFNLTVDGNVDASGTISNGSLAMTGSGALLNGAVGSLLVSGSTFLQGSTKTSGAVSVTGSLTVTDQALNISIP
jgi:hypothetical protein